MPQDHSQPILQALSGKTSQNPPIWMMRQAGRHLPEYMEVRQTTKNFVDFCLSPEKASKVTLQPIERYGMDGAILFADILLIPLALGRHVDFIKGKGPQLDPIEVTDIAKLELSGSSDRLSPIYETVRRVRENMPDETTLVGFCGGAWTVATYMIEGQGSPKKEIAKRFAYENPEDMDRLLEILARSSADYMIAQARAGAQVLKIFESWAENLSPFMFERLVIKPTQLMIKLIREAGINVPIIAFPRGCGLNLKSFAQQIDSQALALGTDVSISEARQMIGDNRCLQGNLDPLALRIGGDVLRQAVDRVLVDIKGPHIFNLGHGVTPDVKIANVHAVINHVRTGHGDYV
ncbi:MAG: uroporphyrinogen decarboxylase [Maricaulaceae bacterium]